MTHQQKSYVRTVTIAGSDSGGGAGIQADLKTFAALGCYGMSVLTALTAQNTVGVQDIHEVPDAFVGQQIDSIAGDIGTDAVKIGMLHDPAIIQTVADKIDRWELPHVVLDPVMVAQSGDKLIKQEAIRALTEHLFPRAEIITPNLPEAEELTGRDIQDRDEVEEAAKQLLEFGSKAVLLKGGHSKQDRSSDCLVYKQDDTTAVQWMEASYIETDNTHGTGCTLSSAIAALRARGYGVVEAVEQSKRYITGAIEAGSRYELGGGSGPLHHFYHLWNENLIQNI